MWLASFGWKGPVLEAFVSWEKSIKVREDQSLNMGSVPTTKSIYSDITSCQFNEGIKVWNSAGMSK